MAGKTVEPLTARSDRGEVLVDGPGTVIASLTPDAAEESGQRLIAAARRARYKSDPSKIADAGDKRTD